MQLRHARAIVKRNAEALKLVAEADAAEEVKAAEVEPGTEQYDGNGKLIPEKSVEEPVDVNPIENQVG